jgi:HAD superfamily hydrolase (TIGR01509 family)
MTQNLLLPAAIIFDMDGVLVDSNPFHLRKWVDLLQAHGIPFNEQELPKIVLGPPNDVTFHHYLGKDLSRDQLAELGEELEANFRREIGPHARAFPGVRRFIEECHAQGIAMAVASMAIAKNVNFIISALGLRNYFREVLALDEIVHPKPDPEVFLKAADKLGVNHAACAVFEDSFVGIEAAIRAGMKCVAIASTFPAEELRRKTHADLIVPSFEAVSLQMLRHLFFNGAGTSAGTRGPS